MSVKENTAKEERGSLSGGESRGKAAGREGVPQPAVDLTQNIDLSCQCPEKALHLEGIAKAFTGKELLAVLSNSRVSVKQRQIAALIRFVPLIRKCRKNRKCRKGTCNTPELIGIRDENPGSGTSLPGRAARPPGKGLIKFKYNVGKLRGRIRVDARNFGEKCCDIVCSAPTPVYYAARGLSAGWNPAFCPDCGREYQQLPGWPEEIVEKCPDEKNSAAGSSGMRWTIVKGAGALIPCDAQKREQKRE